LSPHTALKLGGAAAGILVLAFALGEATGWPILVAPLERQLTEALDRPVRLRGDTGDARFEIRLLPAVRIRAEQVRVDAPAWSTTPHLLLARDLELELGHGDLFRAARGAPVHVRHLSAASLDARIERLADGRASWSAVGATAEAVAALRRTTFGRLRVAGGRVAVNDAVVGVKFDADFTLLDGAESGAAAGLTAKAHGSYRQHPLKVDLRAGHVLVPGAVPVTAVAQVGGAHLSFIGTASNVTPLESFRGRFKLRGPSLAAVGSPVGLTLPTTGPFDAEGLITHDGALWLSQLDRFEIGSSRLAGAFVFDPRPGVPMLAGRLTGPRLVLADLGPAIGLPVPVPVAASAAGRAARASTSRRQPARVLPDRPFDLPSLRAMNADVAIDIEHLDLGSRWLEPLTPLQAQLVLFQGVLRLNDVRTRLGAGRFDGELRLDASGKTTRGNVELALWSAALRWSGVRLEQWVRPPRATPKASPSLTGGLDGSLKLAGQGRSTATILSTLHGSARTRLQAGTLSHLWVEMAGLDVAQALGVALKGDDALPVLCAVLDLAAEQGVLRPRLAVLDTPDSTLLMDGSISLASEAIALQLTVAPKDFSPLALRSPLKITGTLAAPEVSVQKSAVVARVAAAGLLALINPLAALIPLLDPGDSEQAERDAAGCRELSARMKQRAGQPAASAPTPATTPPRPR
jgi:uncharacterized protein involved in outer membrane biogenesis